MTIPLQQREVDRLSLTGLSVAITQWAHDRRIISMENSKGQYMKLVSEFGELCAGVLDNDEAKKKDGVGDTFVMLNNVAAIFGGEIIGLMAIPCQPTSNMLSFYENLGLLADYVAKNQKDKALETIGLLANSLKTICIVALGLNFVECVQMAYDEIKHRRGVMYNGVFVKEDDERYLGIMQELEMQDLNESKDVEGSDA